MRDIQKQMIKLTAVVAAISSLGAGCAKQPQSPLPAGAVNRQSEPQTLADGERSWVVSATPEAISPPAPAETRTPPVTAPTVKTITVVAKRWSFEPAVITVKKGDRVRMLIESRDVTHGIKIPDFNINQNLVAGETTVVEFTADKAGSFGFFCSVFCGQGHGSMRGTLVVEE